MDRSLQKQVAQMYPKKNFQSPRTPLQQALKNSPNKHLEKFYTSDMTTNNVSPRARKFLIIIISCLCAAFLFSSYAYTISDGLASKMSLELFDDNGTPGIPVIVVHMLILGLIMYLVLTGGGY